MVFPPCLRALVVSAVLGLALPLCSPSASAAGFTAIELPPVPTRIGDFAAIGPTGLDRRGRVVGQAFLVLEESPGAYNRWVGFRFDPRTGISSPVDPFDGLHTDVWSVNERGTLFGETIRGSSYRRKLFLHSDRRGFDMLSKGSSAGLRRTFRLHLLTNRGNIAGTASGRPFLYLKKQGWIPIWDRYEPVAETVARVLVNDVGDFALQTYAYTFLSLDGGEIEQIGPEGFNVYLEALGNRHQVIGSYKRQSRHKFDRGGPSRPYVFSPKEGFVDLLPEGARHGVARWILKNGAIYGTATRNRGGDTLFRRIETRGFIPGATTRVRGGETFFGQQDSDIEVQTVDLRQAFSQSIEGYTFRKAKVIDVNNFGQLVAEVKVRPRNLPTCWGFRGSKLFVYFDEHQGFVNLQDAVDELGASLLIFDIVQLNDKGHVIARACRSDSEYGGFPWTGVLLRPR